MKEETRFAFVTLISWLMACLIEILMQVQIGTSLLSGAIWGRIILMTILEAVIIIAKYTQTMLASYGTIIVMLYFGILSLGGILQVSARFSGLGILTQLIGVIGVMTSLTRIVDGFNQRTKAHEARWRKKHK